MTIRQSESGTWDVKCDGDNCRSRFSFSSHDVDPEDIRMDMVAVGWAVVLGWDIESSHDENDWARCYCPDCGGE